jgi:hypothetical protein
MDGLLGERKTGALSHEGNDGGAFAVVDKGQLPVVAVDEEETAYCRWADDGGQNLD